MKIFIVLFAISAISIIDINGSSTGAEINDILDMIPIDKLKAIIDINRNDPEVIEAGIYMRSEEFNSFLSKFIKDRDVIELAEELEEMGVDVEEFILKLISIVDVTPPTSLISRMSSSDGRRSFKSTALDVIHALPILEMKQRVVQLIEKDPKFRTFIEHVNNKGDKILVRLGATPEAQRLLVKLENAGIPVPELLLLAHILLHT